MQSPEPSFVDTGPDEHGPRAAGAAVFFDSTRLSSCHTCHSYHKRGGPLGPDLADEHMSAQEVIASLAEPRRPSLRYPVITVTTKDGTRLTGIRRDDTGDTVRLFDVTVPPVLRTFQKSEIVTIQSVDTGSFDHTALGYTPEQVRDLATLLSTP
jgi:putative heme-binding domain-containing protein